MKLFVIDEMLSMLILLQDAFIAFPLFCHNFLGRPSPLIKACHRKNANETWSFIQNFESYYFIDDTSENDNFRARQFLPIVISTFHRFLFFNSYHRMVILQCDHERAQVEIRPFRVVFFFFILHFFKWANWSLKE